MNKSDQWILEAILPSIVLSLVKQGIISEKHLSDPKKLLARFMRHRHAGIAKTHFYVAIDKSFYASALDAWKNGERDVGLVLFATAIEQLLNESYRFFLESLGFDAKEITKIIRSNNFDAKVSWLFTLITKRRFPDDIATRLRFIAEARNSIVHYKAQPDHIDNDGGSHSHIKELIRSCKGWRLADFYLKLDRFLLEVVCNVDPDHDLTSTASQIIWDERMKVIKAKSQHGTPKKTSSRTKILR